MNRKNISIIHLSNEADRARVFANQLIDSGLNCSIIPMELGLVGEQGGFMFYGVDLKKLAYDIEELSPDIVVPLNSGTYNLAFYYNEKLECKNFISDDLRYPVFMVTDDILADIGSAAYSFLFSDIKSSTDTLYFQSSIINIMNRKDGLKRYSPDRGQIYFLKNINFLKEDISWFPFSVELSSDYNTEEDIDISFCGSMGITLFIKGFEGLFLKLFFEKLIDLEHPLFDLYMKYIGSFNYDYVANHSNPHF